MFDSPLRGMCIMFFGGGKMLKIGEFSILTKTTVKTLRYYEKEGILKPSYIDKETGYRYYKKEKLCELSKILELRSLGITVKNIKIILDGGDVTLFLNERASELKKTIESENCQLQRIIKILEESKMKKEQKVVMKTLPACTVYYGEKVIKDYSKIVEFVLKTGEEAKKLNPDLKCSPLDYCFITYLDGKPNGKDIKIRYSEAVLTKGKENENIKFMDLPAHKALCINHYGAYYKLGETYNIIMDFIEKHNYKIVDKPRECYIDGAWNKESEEDYLTEIQFLVE